MAMTIDFSGQVVVVVGGTSGINLGIAEGFADHGAKVAVASRSQGKVDAAVDNLGARNDGQAMGYSGDVRQPDAMVEFFAAVSRQFGEIDVLISGAAGNFPARAMGMSTNAFKSVVDIDLLGTYHVMRAAFQYLRKPGASVINISAPQSFVPMELQSHVCAAKAGVDMLTRVLAMEWGPEGIRVNAIVPGPITGTEGMDRLAPTDELKALVTETVPLRRDGTPQDIANAAYFLASDLGSYVSGVILPVDGAWTPAGVGVAMNGLVKLAG